MREGVELESKGGASGSREEENDVEPSRFTIAIGQNWLKFKKNRHLDSRFCAFNGGRLSPRKRQLPTFRFAVKRTREQTCYTHARVHSP